MQKTTIALVLAAAVVTFLAGWLIGRWALEREWQNPVRAVTAAEQARASIEGADLTPAAGTQVLRDLPLRRMREAMRGFTAKDPVVAKVGSFARDDDDKDLHLVVHNRGDCKATRVAGVAYGYDARGRPARVNKGGEPYLAFEVKDLKLDAGKSGQLSFKIKDPGVASLAEAHVDLVECEGGRVWRR